MMVEKSFEVWEKRQSAARFLDGNAVSGFCRNPDGKEDCSHV
jgi:hypothetical protein